MTLVIQRAEHRDTQAIQAKLDELLRANSDARTELTRIDDEEPSSSSSVVPRSVTKINGDPGRQKAPDFLERAAMTLDLGK
jgi:low affinity Fe/Cu permease